MAGNNDQQNNELNQQQNTNEYTRVQQENFYAQNKKSSSSSKNNNEQDKKKDKTADLASNLKSMFKYFTIGSFLLGNPVMIGLFAAAIACVILKKGYDWYKGRNKDATQSTKDAFNAVKENSELAIPDKFSKYLDLAKNKDKQPATREEFLENIANASKEFLNSKEGIEAQKNPALNQMFKSCFGLELKEVNKALNKNFIKEVDKVDAINNTERVSRTSLDAPNPALNKEEVKDDKFITRETTLEEFFKEDENKIEDKQEELDGNKTISDVPDKEEVEVDNNKSINDYPDKEEIDNNNLGKSREALEKSTEGIEEIKKDDEVFDIEANEDSFLMDIPDEEFDREIATQEDINKEKEMDLSKEMNSPEMEDSFSIEYNQELNN